MFKQLPWSQYTSECVPFQKIKKYLLSKSRQNAYDSSLIKRWSEEETFSLAETYDYTPHKMFGPFADFST